MTARPAAIYPGTFDPVTPGHVDVMSRALDSLVDRLVVAVRADPAPGDAAGDGKRSLFPLADRLGLISGVLSDVLPPGAMARVELVSFPGLLVSLAREHGVFLVIRGLRGMSDFDDESVMASMNRALDPEIETVFLLASSHLRFVSSLLVREIAAHPGGCARLRQLVHPLVASALSGRFAGD